MTTFFSNSICVAFLSAYSFFKPLINSSANEGVSTSTLKKSSQDFFWAICYYFCMINKKCIVIIDGSNFYFKLKDLDLHNLLSLDFTQFLLHIS